MRLFHQRPLALAACMYAICSICLYQTNQISHFVFLCLVLIAILILSVICILKKKVGKTGIVCFLCLGSLLLSTLSSFYFFKVHFAGLQTYIGQPITVQGTVEERIASDSFFSRLRIRVRHVNGESQNFCALLDCEYPSSLQVGDTFEIEVTPREFIQDDVIKEKNNCVSDGCMLILTSDSFEDCTRLHQKSQSFWAWTSRLNTKESYDLYQTVGREGGGISVALLLGNRDFLSSSDIINFRYAGVSHLLALSGLHVSILVGFLEFLLNKFRIAKICRAILIPLTAVGYLFLTGCSASAIRAVLMVCILYIAFLWRGEYDSFTALSIALVLILLLMPYSVLDVSLWLSFTAAGGIIVFVPFVNRLLNRWKEKSRLPKFAVSAISGSILAISVGVIANVVLLPISAVVFGEISLWSIPATLLLSIPITLLLIVSLIVFLCPVLPLLPDMCNWLGDFILSVTESLGHVSGALIPLRGEWCHTLLILLVVSLILLAILRIKKAVWAVVPLVLCVAIVGNSVYRLYEEKTTPWQMTAIEAGHGEVRLYTKNGRAILIHDSYGITNSSFEIKDAANKAMCTEIEAVIFCKNYNQATYFISSLAERMRVHKIYLQTPHTDYEFAMLVRIYEEAQKYGIPLYVGAEEQIPLYESSVS